nr:DUF6233 domain-containing protein [Streptomyces antibioticus]
MPNDLSRLQTLLVWHAHWSRRIDAKIAAAKQLAGEEEQNRGARPAPPEWVVELGIGAGRPPVQVHAGDCYAVGKRRRPAGRAEARRVLAEGLPGCTHCQPDTRLGILGLSPRPAPRLTTVH